MFKGIKIWGVLVAFVCDILLAAGLGALFGAGMMIITMHANPGDFKAAITEYVNLVTSPKIRFLLESLGSLGSFTGGFIASWIGSAARMKNMFCLMVLEQIFSAVVLGFESYLPPMWLYVYGFAIGITGNYLGGLLAKKIL